MSHAVVIVIPQGAPIWVYVVMIALLLVGLAGVAVMAVADWWRSR